MSIPRVLIPDNAVATDKAVGMIQTELAARYDWLDHAFGVSQLMTKRKQRTDYNYPAVHYKNDRYLDMFPTNKMGNTCFFIADDPQGIEEFNPNISNRLVFDCSVVFWVNLNDIYPNETSRQKENLKIELLNFFNNVMKFQGARFKVSSVAERFENVYAEYSEDEIKSQYLMHPYCALRFEGEMTVDQECIITQPLTYDLTLEAGEGGTVQPYEGSQAQNIGSNVAVYADPDENNTFDRWEFNGVVSLDNPTIVAMNRTVNGLAYFISSIIKPCMDNLCYQSGIYNSNYLLDLSEYSNNAKLINSNSLTTNGINNVGKLSSRLYYLLDTSNVWEIEYIFKRTKLGDEIILADWSNYGFTFQINGANVLQLVMRRSSSSNELYVRSTTVLNELNKGYKVNIKYDGSKDESGLIMTINDVVSAKTIVANTLTSQDITSPTSTGTEILSRTDINFYSSTNAIRLSIWADRDMYETPNILDLGFAEGESNTAYDTSGQNNHVTFDGDLLNLWDTKQGIYHKNILNGFDLWVDDLITPTKFLRIPFNNLGNSIKTNGDTVSGFVWKSRNEFEDGVNNNAETLLDFTDGGRNYCSNYEGDEVIVLAGQSMVAGYNNNEQPFEYLKQPNVNAKIVGINNGIKEVSTFETIDFDTLNNMGEIAGLELMLCYKFGTKKIWIIKVCQGGTDLHTDWATGTVLRNKLIEYISYAKGELTNPRFNFYWGQWYDSVQNASSYNNYKTDFDGLVNEVETTCSISFNSFTLEAVNVNANQYIGYPTGGNAIIQAQQEIVNERNGVLIDISDQTLWDGTHLTNAGFNTLAERIFELGLIPKISNGLFPTDLNSYQFGDEPTQLNKSFFMREKSETKEDRYLVYSEEITGECLDKTLEYINE